MAKPKQEVLVETIWEGFLKIWANDPTSRLNEIRSIEGVEWVEHKSGYSIGVGIDPRYSTEEVAQEIEELLTASVPPVFTEVFEEKGEI